MQKLKTIFILAIVGAIWPYLGIPRTFKDFFTFVLGVAIAFLVFSVMRKEKKPVSVSTPQVAETFVENGKK